jgi:hypothetical protein
MNILKKLFETQKTKLNKPVVSNSVLELAKEAKLFSENSEKLRAVYDEWLNLLIEGNKKCNKK